MTKEELQAKCNELGTENDQLKAELKVLEDASLENGTLSAVSVAAVVKSVTKDAKTGGSTVEIRPARGGGWVAVALPVDEDGGLAAGDEVFVNVDFKPTEASADTPEASDTPE